MTINTTDSVNSPDIIGQTPQGAEPGQDDGMVEIMLFKDKNKYSGDLPVGLNGKLYQIQRGVRVRVPKAVAEIIRNSEKQNAEAMAYMESAPNNMQ